jgi:hypothetical protein
LNVKAPHAILNITTCCIIIISYNQPVHSIKNMYIMKMFRRKNQLPADDGATKRARAWARKKKV